jgi:hypothetical protein
MHRSVAKNEQSKILGASYIYVYTLCLDFLVSNY